MVFFDVDNELLNVIKGIYIYIPRVPREVWYVLSFFSKEVVFLLLYM